MTGKRYFTGTTATGCCCHVSVDSATKTDRTGLLWSIKEMNPDIRRYEDRHSVVSPEELAQQLNADETAG